MAESAEGKRPAQGIAEVAGSPLELDFNGELIKFSPLTLKDFGELENFVKSIRLRTVLETYRQMGTLSSLERAEKAELITSITSATIEPIDFVSSLVSVQGGMHMIWLSARKEQPEITKDYLTGFITTPDDIVKIVKDISGVALKSGGEATDPPAEKE